MFKTLDQIEDYLGGEKIECLICGKKLSTLGTHLRRMHDWTVEEYKEHFGIPIGRGLVSEKLHQLLQIRAKEKLEVSEKADPGHWERIQELARLGREKSYKEENKHGASVPATIALLKEQIKVARKICLKKYNGKTSVNVASRSSKK